ncbi:hypothetical protein [Saccharothrix coeruleofusca]|uniref:DUF4168 domain-containing protein n=1 Tax=Saccharothrix coeruleofusca TaxID=33919 RepID=A0A918AS67_9PSEU|nr:hypothetical protein [Saccharothrix coeruleofusca]MBP2335898.1 hypothetical protein [Saccharothrix coeruleofusca]GGP76777.1 hypothetical protein GCM10010185_58180 [Saccharothrix coeruleofusca]
MGIRGKLIAAVLTAGALTAVVSANVSTALASQPPATQSAAAAGAGQEDNLHKAARLLAVELGISGERALQVLRVLERVVPEGAITDDPRFIIIAKDLGVSPQRLSDALTAVKMKL